MKRRAAVSGVAVAASLAAREVCGPGAAAAIGAAGTLGLLAIVVGSDVPRRTSPPRHVAAALALIGGEGGEKAMTRITTIGLGALASAALAACGGGGDSNDESAAPMPSKRPTAPATVDTLVLRSVPGTRAAFDTRRLTAKAGKVLVKLDNVEDVSHNVRFAEGTKCCSFGPGTHDAGGTNTVDMGKIEAVVDLKPGKYVYYCTVAGHWQQGMWGRLTVT